MNILHTPNIVTTASHSTARYMTLLLRESYNLSVFPLETDVITLINRPLPPWSIICVWAAVQLYSPTYVRYYRHKVEYTPLHWRYIRSWCFLLFTIVTIFYYFITSSASELLKHKGKAVPLRARGAQRVPGSLGSQITWQWPRMVVRLSPLRTGRF